MKPDSIIDYMCQQMFEIWGTYINAVDFGEFIFSFDIFPLHQVIHWIAKQHL